MKKFLMTACISLFFLTSAGLAADKNDKNDKNCALCHDQHSSGAHKNLECVECHSQNSEHFDKAANFATEAKGCLSCHENYSGMMHSAMVHRESEKKFVHKTFNGIDNNFYDKNCKNCHVTSCTDCHQKGDAHEISKPDTDTCQKCHRDYYIGIEYTGLGQREDHERYDRGIEQNGSKYASMLPDIHHEKGMNCSDCHSMESLAKGQVSSKSCTDCHTPDKSIIEHSIAAHMEKMECYTCHSAWANQEYGTFWIKLEDTAFDEYFRWVKRPHIDYAKSSHTKEYTKFPIAVNKAGKYSPIRPEYITFLTHVKGDKVQGTENRMISNFYKAVFPHTIRRETVTCEQCHKTPKRFMRETRQERIFDLQKDGLMVDSFYNMRWYRLSNGRFADDDEFERIMTESPEYQKLIVKKWQQIIKSLSN
ncbi:selenite/tellurite reduction operon b-type cytochrome iron-sulfur cluster-binding subunit ExtO [Deferribacteres bacterium DY0037]